jgi:hypothetical protein
VLKDVWVSSSTDPCAWTKKPDFPGTRYQFGYAAVSSNTRIILIGGSTGIGPNYRNDVWVSDTKYESWTQMSASAPFRSRVNHGVVNVRDYIYVIGGWDDWYGPPTAFNDIWLSGNLGATWMLVTQADSFAARFSFGLAQIGNQVYLLAGGNPDAIYNDVWVAYL